jgi:hypothetical protein
MKESIKNIAYSLSWIASYLAMTLAEGDGVYHKGRGNDASGGREKVSRNDASGERKGEPQ